MNRFNRYLLGGATVLTCLCISSMAVAEEKGQDATYSGDLLTRSTLTGDWGGARNDLAKKGVTFDINFVQTAQGVVDGGKNSSWENGGRGDLTFMLDTGKMGLWPGGFLTAELEGNYGHAVNLYTGSLMAADTNQLFPVTGQEGVALPALNYAQFLSEYFGVVVGKLDTLTNGDQNEFAHGKGDTQFMNLALNVNPVIVMTAPYSTLGAGMILLPNKDPKSAVVSFSVLSSEGFANTTGLNEISADKLTFSGEARVRTDFLGKTGHQLVGYSYSNKEFTSLDQRLGEFLVNREFAKVNGSWAFFYNFDQYLYEPEKGSGKGFGIFGRLGVSDGDANPIHNFYSLGVGGKGLMSNRPIDQFGIGWYAIAVANLAFTGPLQTRDLFQNEQGVEAYYSIALTPWSLLTPNIQFIHPAQEKAPNGEEVKDSTVLGLRLRLLL